MESMRGVNAYWQTFEDHRAAVGGLWEELGPLQLTFLQEHGLKPHHTLLDIGCGSLRGGLHLIPYLDAGCYFGTDINLPLVEQAQVEIAQAGLESKDPRVICQGDFDFSVFETAFDYALAFSVFTHLFANNIGRCLKQLAAVLKPEGQLYATFFEAPTPLHTADLTQMPGGFTTHMDSDPFHYSLEEMSALAEFAGLNVENVPSFQHPRGQRMLRFMHA